MPSTARGYPYPSGGDSPDGPTQIQALAQAVNDDVDVVEDAAAAAATDYEFAYSTWKPLGYMARGGILDSTDAAVQHLLSPAGNAGAVLSGNPTLYQYGYPLDVDDLDAGPRSTMLRVVANICPNGTAPGIAYRVELFTATVTKPAGSGNYPYISALTTVAGSEAITGTLSATTAVRVEGAAFAAPAANYYVIGTRGLGSAAGNVAVIAGLEYAQT